MKIASLLIIISFTSTIVFGQNYQGYSDDKLEFESVYLKETISLNLHIPETFNFSAESTKYPITIVFDSQHERTYPQIINAIDLLTNESQIPESIVIGVPFNRTNRYYLTSNQVAKNDTLMGIERMEKFLFEELLPELQKKYKANDFLTLVGHSRTAFLVNYLLTSQSENVDVAIASSGFYSNEPLSAEAFKAHISTASNSRKSCVIILPQGLH